MTFPFVSRSLYDSRIAGHRVVVQKYRDDLTDAYSRIVELNQTIGSLKNRVANLNNSYDSVSNELSKALAVNDFDRKFYTQALTSAELNVSNLRNALAEADTATGVLHTENLKLKAVAKCLKTSSKRKKSA